MTFEVLEPLTVKIQGQIRTLKVGERLTLPDLYSQRLLAKANGKVRLLTPEEGALLSSKVALRVKQTDKPESLPNSVSLHGARLPESPLQPGWLVAYRNRSGKLCGGCDNRDAGTVDQCVWNGTSWDVWLTNGQPLPLSSIRSVGKTDAEGKVIAAWMTLDHGFNGES